MRKLGCTAALLGCLGAGAASAPAADITPKAMLNLRPTRAGVEYDTPTDAAAIDACKVELVTDPQKKTTIGYALRDGQGKLLRRFVSTRGKALNQWSYYQDGFEVYRESDLNGDQSLDECRWMNAGGTRIATIQDSKVAGWKRLSAEEASKMAVQALATNDAALLDSLMATPEELKAAGVPDAVVAKVTADAPKRAEAVQALQKSLVGWSDKTVWNRFDGTLPHVIPADPATGVANDLVLYENAVIFAGLPAPAAGAAPAAKLSFLQVPEMIKLDDVWKFVELPRAVDPEKPVVASSAGLRSAIFETVGGDVPQHDEEMEAALKALAEFDKANSAMAAGDKKQVAKFHLDRTPLLRAVAKAAKDPEDQLSYNKQFIDSVVAAYQTGAYSQGRKVLDGIIEKKGELGSYAAFRLIGAEFVMRGEEPGANFVAVQKKWMGELEDFLKEFPKSDEAPEALLQLASASEFNAEEDKAREDYAKLVESFPESIAGKKAAGALRRLDLVGKSVSIKGAGAQGETVDTSQFAGKPVLVVFWASWGGQSVRREIPDLVKLAEKYAPKGLQIVGVSLDTDKADLEAFQQEQKLNWPQIFEPGSMESRLAVEYGVGSLPTMFLIDAQGKVVNRNLRTASEADRQIEKTLGQKPPAGVALGGEK
jgi:peroxiredoxin